MLVKTSKKGNITVNIYDDYIPKDKEEYNRSLSKLYDLLNQIEIPNKEELFYTKEELMKIKKEGCLT